MPTETIAFANRHGRTLAARLETPTGPRVGVALLAHCFACSKNLTGLVRLSRALAADGFAVLRFDFTGLGESEGEAFEGGLGGDATDLLDAAAWLEANVAPVDLLVGHSLGGLAALQAAPDLPALKALATIGSPSDPQHVTQHLTPSAGTPPESTPPEGGAPEGSAPEGSATEDASSGGVPTGDTPAGDTPTGGASAGAGRRQVEIAGRTFALQQTFFDELERRSPVQCLAESQAAVMVMHAVTDNTVGIHHAETLFKAAKHPKSFVSLGQADHLLTRAEDAQFAASVLAGWAAGLLGTRAEADGTAARDAAQASAGGRDPELDPKTVRVTTGGSYATDAQVAGFPMRMDEPTDVGGSDTGPNPGALLRAALASCTSITLRMYANRKEWPLEAVDVTVASTSERKDGTVHTHMTREVTLHGDLSDEQRQRLIEIADRCPVHRTLEGEITIETTEATAG